MGQGPDQPKDERLAEIYLRRALIDAELEGRDLVSALRAARCSVAAGKHLEAGSDLHEEVRAVVDSLVSYLIYCRNAEVSFEHGGVTLSAQDVLDDLGYVLGVDEMNEEEEEEEEGIRHGLARMFALTAGK